MIINTIKKIVSEISFRQSNQALNTQQNVDPNRFYFSGTLNELRFSKSEIESAISTGRSRFRDASMYFVSDLYYNLIQDDRLIVISVSDIISLKDDKVKVFICAFESDQKLVDTLKLISSLQNAYYYTPTVYYPTARYFHRNDIARKVLTEEQQLPLSKFEVADFENIIQAIQATRQITGSYVEIGVYQGRSAHMALHYMKAAGIRRSSFFFDIFEGFTYDEATASADAIWANTHTDTSLELVSDFLSPFPDVVVEKLNIITGGLPSTLGAIAVCNIDVDMCEAVAAALVKVAPKIALGGIIIVEDQGHTPALAGAFLALTEFMETEISQRFIPVHMTSGQMFLVRYV